VFLAIMVFKDIAWSSASHWANITWVFPVGLFFSTMSILLTQWANVLWKSSRVQSFFLALNGLVYITLITFVVYTVRTSNYALFVDVTLKFIGCLELIASVGCLFLGLKILEKLTNVCDEGIKRNLYVKIEVSCFLCCFVFVVRGLISIMLAVDATDALFGLSLPAYHFVVLLLTEWAPSIAFVFILQFWHSPSLRNPYNTIIEKDFGPVYTANGYPIISEFEEDVVYYRRLRDDVSLP